MAGGRTWSEEDIAKLRSMAGRRPAKDIAAALGRTVEATVVTASKLKLSLRTRFHFGRTVSGRVPSRSGRDQSASTSPIDEAGIGDQQTLC
jgi:hypothetical protein